MNAYKMLKNKEEDYQTEKFSDDIKYHKINSLIFDEKNSNEN